ncbi:MAG: endonuclease NucS, partial [Actinomycetia bacterium]|nr:endonuclease NucS [Actinomycetes bacterium]
MRIVVARCSVEYQGRLTTELPEAVRLLMIKGDGTLLIHNDRGGKPLNWMSPPCRLVEEDIDDADSTSDGATRDAPEGTKSIWTVTNKAGEHLVVYVYDVQHDSQHHLGQDPGLVKDGVEAHLQKLLAEHVETFGSGWTLVRREYPTAIGPVDLLCRDEEGKPVAVEI